MAYTWSAVTNNTGTTLNGSHAIGSASLTVIATGGFPATGYLAIDSGLAEWELVRYSAIASPTSFTLVGTTANLHATGGDVSLVVAAENINELRDVGGMVAAGAANRVLATATSGGAAAPTIRALVAADIPVLSYAPVTHDIFSATHADTAGAASPVDGDTIIGNVTPKWSKLAISIPAANVRNVLGIDNGELRPSWKTALDATAPATLTIAGAAAAGTSLVFSHRDHVHPITASPAFLGNGAMQYQTIVTGATPFVPVYSGFLLDGTTGGKTVLAVTNAKVLTLTSAETGGLTLVPTASKTLTLTYTDNWNLTIPATGTAALLGTANVFTLINPLTTIAESWIGPSSTTGIYFKSGNVGIGTTGPTNKLDISVGAAAGGFNQGISILSGNGTYTTGHGGMLQFQNEDVITAGIRGVREGGWTSGMAFYTHNSSAGNTFGTTFLERMRIDNSGSVGIGTTAPNTKLQIYSGATGATETLRLEGKYGATGDGPLLRFTNQHVSGTNPNSGEYNLAGIQAYDYDSAWGGALAFQTSGTGTSGGGNLATRMVISPTGNVGIGTVAPQKRLHVVGTILVDGDEGGYAGTTGFTDIVDIAARSTGVGTILFDDATNRNSVGFIKIYIGTVAHYIPVFDAIT